MRPISEDELADAWEQRGYAGRYLVDCCGRQLQVVFPGRRWFEPGPDFKGAVLALRDGTLVHGDVEVHVRASSWIAHHHALDPLYQSVVLHVVQHADVAAADARGVHIHAVELAPAPGQWWPHREPVPCLRDASEVLPVVRAAGLERFLARAAQFEAELRAEEADQVVWRGVAVALGFRRNSRPFGQLADAIPWAQAARAVADRGPVGLAGVLLGAAGLVAETTLPEAHAWRAAQRALRLRPALRTESWDRRQVRSANSPERRCRGLAELAARWIGEVVATGRGPAGYITQAVNRGTGLRHPRLCRLVEASPWIGHGRAQVIVINVLLPFAAASGVGGARDLFERYPGEPANRVLRYMARQLGAPAIQFRGACQQQGLLQLFRATCAARVCERCPARAGPGGRNNLELLDV